MADDAGSPALRSPQGDQLVVAVLRMRVSSDGELVYGETVGAEGERRGRFSSWTGMVADVRSLVAEALHGDAHRKTLRSALSSKHLDA